MKDVKFRWFRSEGEEPFAAYSSKKKFPQDANIEKSMIGELLRHCGKAPNTPTDVSSFDKFMAAVKDPANTSDFGVDVASYLAMEKVMRDELSELRVISIGNEKTTVTPSIFFVGRAEDGTLAGLETKVVWT